jgi:hypothetical protein
MIGSLNPKRYRVEHLFDLAEGVLRAKIVLAHSIVVHLASVDRAALRDLEAIAERCTAVIVSSDASRKELAERLDGRFVAEPLETHVFKRAVYRAVSKTQERRHRDGRAITDSGTRTPQRVALLHPSAVQAAVMAAVLRNQLGAACDIATTPGEVLKLLEREFHCVVADPTVLLTTPEGAQVAQQLARRGVPVVPLTGRDHLDVSSAGQAAWDIAPQVRRSLTARMKVAG